MDGGKHGNRIERAIRKMQPNQGDRGANSILSEKHEKADVPKAADRRDIPNESRANDMTESRNYRVCK